MTAFSHVIHKDRACGDSGPKRHVGKSYRLANLPGMYHSAQFLLSRPVRLGMAHGDKATDLARSHAMRLIPALEERSALVAAQGEVVQAARPIHIDSFLARC